MVVLPVLSSTFALLLTVMHAAPEPIPVQRPTSMEPSPPPAPVEPLPEPAPEPAPEPPAPASTPTVELAPPSAPRPELEPHARGRIAGMVTDTELRDVPMSGVRVVVRCTCLDQERIEVTDVDGRYLVEDLPIGVYTIVADRGGRPTRRIVSLGPSDEAHLDLQVAPPTTTKELERRRREETTARTMMAMGGLSGVAGGLLLIASAVEDAKHECMFGLDDCASAPRPQVTVGLGVAGGVLVAGGAALVGLGVHRQRRLRASIAVDDRAAALHVVGRF